VATEVKLPRLGQGMESGTIVKWLKSEGDAVEKGDALYELDTDKVTQGRGRGVRRIAEDRDLDRRGRSREDDRLHRRAGRSGRLGRAAGEAGGEKPSEPAPPAREAQPAAEGQPSNGSTNGRIKASPLARRIARERGHRACADPWTGPEGRIVAEDVERAGAEPSAPGAPAAPVPSGEVETRPLSNVRKTIARRLTQAWTVPAFQLTVNADMTRANELVTKQRELNPEVRITLTDVLTKVCAQG